MFNFVQHEKIAMYFISPAFKYLLSMKRKENDRDADLNIISFSISLPLGKTLLLHWYKQSLIKHDYIE